MAQNNVAQKDSEIYLVIVNRFCPDCGSIQPHRIYEQSFKPRMDKLLVLSDCLTCMNTRTIKAYRNGVEVPIKG